MARVRKSSSFFIDFLKGALISVLIGSILTLILAIILNFTPISDTVIIIINQIIKILSIFLGCLFGFREKKNGIIKGLILGLLYSVITVVISGLINKNLSLDWGVCLDGCISSIIGGICGIISVNFFQGK